jgi:hypothetical protein
MIEPPEQIKRRLLFIVHRAWIETRELAKQNKSEQLYDLADAVHSITSYMSHWKDENSESIRLNLKTYCVKYPESAKRFQYMEFLDQWDPLDF